MWALRKIQDLFWGRQAAPETMSAPPDDYRRHLPQSDIGAGAPPARRKDWANAVTPLFGACPYTPKTRKQR